MPIKFKKLRPNRIFQKVVEQIQEAIIEGRLKPGETLPSELKLKDMFATSRGTIREALRVLEQKGLVEIKIGVTGGAIVRSVDTRKMTESLDLLIQYQKISFDHLAEFRGGVEGISASLAAIRATDDDIDKLHDLLKQAKVKLFDSHAKWQDFIKIDVKIHIAIAEITKNPVYVAVLHMIHENILGSHGRYSLKDQNILEENYQDLRNLIKSIENKNPEKARSFAQQHVDRFNQHMKNSTIKK